MENISAVFKEKKLKLTPQRIAVYKYLCSTNEHPSAETIYKALQPDYPTMSLATVYKTLKTLTEVNLIQELNVGEGSFRYDATISAHPHIQCLNCGKVDDICGMPLNDIIVKASEYTDYKILGSKLYMFGICNNCK